MPYRYGTGIKAPADAGRPGKTPATNKGIGTLHSRQAAQACIPHSWGAGGEIAAVYPRGTQ